MGAKNDAEILALRNQILVFQRQSTPTIHRTDPTILRPHPFSHGQIST